MSPVQSFQVCNDDMNSTYVNDGARSGDSKHDNWCLVSTNSQEKGLLKDHQLS